MNNSASNSLSLLSRRNEGKKLLSSFILDIEERTTLRKSDLTFIPLDKSDQIRHRFEVFFTDIQLVEGAIIRKTWDGFSSFCRESNDFISPLILGSAYLLFQSSDKIGALKVDSQEIKENFPSILEVDGDSIYACNKDMSFGLVLDKYEENGVWLYEAISCKSMGSDSIDLINETIPLNSVV